MKTALILILLTASYCSGQNLAVRFWRDEPTNSLERVLGVPLDWPSSTKKLSGTNAPAGWRLMTTEQLSAHKLGLQASFDQWYPLLLAHQRTERDLERSSRQARVAEHAALKAELRGKTNVTPVEAAAILEKVLALMRLEDELEGK